MTKPKFKTEHEEAQWLADNRKSIGAEFAKAMRAGKTTRLTREQLIERLHTMA